MSNTPAIRIGISGYGNLGRSAAAAIQHAPDMQLAAIFTRRDPAALQLPDSQIPAYSLTEVEHHVDAIDVMILCGGSKDDLPHQGPELARLFNTVDSFDTHAKIPQYFETMNAIAQSSGHVSVLSIGWDPGLFSLNRMLGEAVLPQGSSYTFWGKGLSQGHSDALRKVPGVKAGVQYTIPLEEAMARVRSGEQPKLSTREKHRRECFVVLHDGADEEQVRHDIISMPDYFADYDTSVHFVSADVLEKDHAAMPHGGFVIRTGKTGDGHSQRFEFSLALGSNPGFTASVMLAYARAAWRLHQNGATGARTIFDIPPGLLSPRSAEELRQSLL